MARDGEGRERRLARTESRWWLRPHQRISGTILDLADRPVQAQIGVAWVASKSAVNTMGLGTRWAARTSEIPTHASDHA